MMQKILNSFFGHLGDRLSSENTLSDITWSLTKTVPAFEKLFLEFFFGDIIAHSNMVIESYREYSEADSRPDFYFLIDGQEYIIEVKKFDQNNHFEQYKKAFPNRKGFGFIAIYKLYVQDEEIVIKTWKEFYDYLNTQLPALTENDKILIESYLQYIKKVCYIINIDKMKLTDLESLFFFNTVIEELIGELSKYATYPYYAEIDKKSKSFDQYSSGWYMILTSKQTNKSIYLWLGISYVNNIKICLAIHMGGIGKDLTDKILKENLSTLNNWINSPYMDEDYLWLEMPKEMFQKFHEVNADEQKKIIRNFFHHILNAIEPFF